MPISSPATGLPATRWLEISFWARLWPISALVDGDPGATRGADVVATRADQAVVLVLLDDVRRPARDAAGRDHGREEIDGNAERVEERRRVEIDVRDQLLCLVDARMELHGHLVPLELAGLPARLLGHSLEDRGTRVTRFVDAVAHAHEAPLRRHRLPGEAVAFGALADLHHRAHDRLAGAAVERSLERADAAGHRRVHVRLRRDDTAGGEGRRVQLVLRVERQARVDRLG